MRILKELRKKFINKNLKIVNKISRNVFKISYKNKNYILKRIEVPLTSKEIIEQHKFIEYLYDNKVPVAKIINIFPQKNKLYELQEHIKTKTNNLDIEKLIILLANFHEKSFEYKYDFCKKNIYKYKFKCKNARLNYLLLGFKEKYNVYPIKKLEKNYKLIYKANRELIDKLIYIYNICYNYFINNYNFSSCIIHNDITSNNVLNKNGKLYLIDFDLAIKSSEYVDFVDAIIKRYSTLLELIQGIHDLNLDYYIELYNKHNKHMKLDIKGVYCMIILKIISFNFYVMLNRKNKKQFNENINRLYIFINEIYSLFKEVEL